MKRLLVRFRIYMYLSPHTPYGRGGQSGPGAIFSEFSNGLFTAAERPKRILARFLTDVLRPLTHFSDFLTDFLRTPENYFPV